MHKFTVFIIAMLEIKHNNGSVVTSLGGGATSIPLISPKNPQNSLLLVLNPHFAPIHPPPVPGGLFPANGRVVVNWLICGLSLFVTSLVLLIALVQDIL